MKHIFSKNFAMEKARFINDTTLQMSRDYAIPVKKQAIKDLQRIQQEFAAVVESLELMANKDFMDSYATSRKQVKARDFDDWHDL